MAWDFHVGLLRVRPVIQAHGHHLPHARHGYAKARRAGDEWQLLRIHRSKRVQAFRAE
ncbi:hypothetical protein D9M71_835560 [compost metagenome]